MATLKTRWHLSIFLVILATCFAVAVPPGLPAPPSQPECHIPCDEEGCSGDIHCTWNQRQEILTTYSLHWKTGNNIEHRVFTGTSLSGLIQREHFTSHGELCVWVQAKNQHGTTNSNKTEIDTHEIIKPPPPKITPIHPTESLEIQWKTTCDQLQYSLGSCGVRHRTEADQDWLEEEDGFLASYTFANPQDCTAYEFQVRCACYTGLKSNWSASYRLPRIERTPIGVLDVWWDCDRSPAICVLIWKRLPASQACGLILGYEVTLVFSNGTAALVNVSTAKTSGKLVCDDMQCHFNSYPNDTSAVSVSAYNAHGASVPSNLTMQVPAQSTEHLQNEQTLFLILNEENLTVSWDLPSHVSDTLKEYVVQYKQECPPGKAFDWVKVNKSQTTAFFKGQFENYRPYQVSLFAVSHDSEIRHLSSAIGYSLEGTPSKVSSFKVFSIADTHVTLLWEPGPLCEQDGLILYYQIGIDGPNYTNVYNVNASSQRGNWTFQVTPLSPGKKYEAWIRAVTKAGAGEKVTTGFKTHEFSEYYRLLIGIVGLCIICIICSVCLAKNKVCLRLVSNSYWDKVPDPRNSHIFKEMKHQINDQMAWIFIPVHEPHPKISLLEVVEVQPSTSESSLEKTSATDALIRPAVGEGGSQMDGQDDQREDAVTEEGQRAEHKYGREAYSKMVDSDEERDRGDCCDSSEEEQGTSGYEKHFMPSALEILEVS